VPVDFPLLPKFAVGICGVQSAVAVSAGQSYLLRSSLPSSGVSGYLIQTDAIANSTLYLDYSAAALAGFYSSFTVTLLGAIDSISVSSGSSLQYVGFNCICTGPQGLRFFSMSSGSAGGTFQVGSSGQCSPPILTKSGNSYSTSQPPSVILPYDCGTPLNVSIQYAPDGRGLNCTLPGGSLVFNGGNGFGAAGTYTAINGSLSSFRITSRGRGYTSVPSVSVSDSSCALYDLNISMLSPELETRQITSYSSSRKVVLLSAFAGSPSAGMSYRLDPPFIFPMQQVVRDNSTAAPFSGCASCLSNASSCQSCGSCSNGCAGNDRLPLRIHPPAFIVKKNRSVYTMAWGVQHPRCDVGV